MPELTKFWLRLATFGLSLLLLLAGLAAAEALARWYGLGNPVLYYETESYRYAVAPDQSTTRFAGAEVNIDKYGLRTNDNWDSAGATRILFIGDSVTYGGSYIDNRQLFSTKTCAALNPEVHAVCGNAGTNGYGTDNMAYRIRFSKLPRPNLYVVTILSEDTVRGMASLPEFPLFSRPLLPLVPGLTEVSLFALDWMRARLRFNRGGGPYQGIGSDADAVAALSLERLFAELRTRHAEGSAILLVHTPSKSAVSKGYSVFDEKIVETMKATGFPLLEVRAALAGQPALDEVYHDGVHLSVAGHALYGELLASALQPLLDSLEIAR